MKKIHPEFAYQSRELGIQMEDTLGDPPDRKYYAKVVKSLVDEFAQGSQIDDVNLLSFALAGHLQFNDIAGLLAESQSYDHGDAAKTLGMVSCSDAVAAKALATVGAANSELARRAIVTAFLFKHPKRWTEEDHSLETLGKNDDGDDTEDADKLTSGHDIDHLFDANGDKND